MAKQVFAAVEVLSTAHYGRDAARGLLEAERLLSEHGRVTQEWADVWQSLWRRQVASLLDLRDVPLCTAALQTHVTVTPDLLPRSAFIKIAADYNCGLAIPGPGDEVVILRAGLMRHLERYKQLLGIVPLNVSVGGGARHAALQSPGAPDVAEAPEAATEGTTAPGSAKTEEESMGDALAASNTATTRAAHADDCATGAPVLIAPKVREAAADRLKSDWQTLEARAAELRPVERYVVRSIVYRRHLADISDLETDEASEAAQRWPVAWLCLRPARFAPKHQMPERDIVLPLALDVTQPDYVLKAEDFAGRTRVAWRPGDRFRVYIGGRTSVNPLRRSKSGGVWHRGTVVAVEPPMPSARDHLYEKEAYDPWESIVVEWDAGMQGDTERISPWELEIDPDEEQRRCDEARKQQQAAARAQRARASARRPTDAEEAAAQDAEWAAQDAKLAELTAQAERATYLLLVHRSRMGTEEGLAFNEAVYGNAAQQAAQAALANVGAPLLAANAAAAAAAAAAAQAGVGPAPGAASASKASGSGAGAATPSSVLPSTVPTGPLKPGQEVSEQVLEALRALTSDQFLTLVTNFYRGLKGKFKVPIFAHQELNLHAVWWAVMDRGGYEAVSKAKLWRDICRVLPLDLSGQTSASYNMRLNYERCLLDFENYLACGQYEVDLAAGRAPAHTHLTDPSVTRFTIPGAYELKPTGDTSGKGNKTPKHSKEVSHCRNHVLLCKSRLSLHLEGAF